MGASDRFATDTVLGKWLAELTSLEVFQAQLELEDRLLSSSRERLEQLVGNDPTALGLEYTRVKTRIETIRELQMKRKALIEQTRADPALKERNKNGERRS